MYNKVKVSKGSGGWGGPLIIEPTSKKNKIVYVTGGVTPELAKDLASKTNCELVDGFKNSVKDEEIAAVIINCGGTLRCGIYPQKNILTINVLKTGKSGPLAKFINENNYVSGVKPINIKVLD